MKTFLLIFFAVLIHIVLGEKFSNISCVVKYLKDKSVLSSTFASVLEPQSEEHCYKIVDDLKSAFDRDVIADLKAEADQICVSKLFHDYKVSDFFLKGFVYHFLNLGSISDFKNEAFESTRDTLKAALAICSAEEKYGKMFDEALKHRGDEKVSIVDDSSQQCIIKYYFEMQILNVSEFNFDDSTINATNCEEIYKSLDDSAGHGIYVDESLTIYGLPSIDVQRCSNKQFIDEKVLLKLTSFEVAINLNQSELNLKKLRSEYIQWNTANLRFLLGCLEKLN